MKYKLYLEDTKSNMRWLRQESEDIEPLRKRRDEGNRDVWYFSTDVKLVIRDENDKIYE